LLLFMMNMVNNTMQREINNFIKDIKKEPIISPLNLSPKKVLNCFSVKFEIYIVGSISKSSPLAPFITARMNRGLSIYPLSRLFN